MPCYNPDTVAGFEQVKFGLPVKVMKGTMRVRVEAKLERKQGDVTGMSAGFGFDKFEGVVFGEREHHEATVRLVKKSDDLVNSCNLKFCAPHHRNASIRPT